MRLLTNRIVISIAVIILVAYIWEFHAKPVTGPIYLEALQQYDRGNYKRSLELLDKAYLIDPNDTTTLTLIGWNYHKMGRFNDAEPYFTRALRLDPGLDEARLGLAHCWLEQGQPQKALDTFEQLPSAYKKSADLKLAVARAYRLTGNNGKALQLLEEVLGEQPDNKLARKELGLLAGTEDPAVLAALRSRKYVRPEKMVVAARLRGSYFEVEQGGEWKQIYLAGVNLGPGRPGLFASEPPTDPNTYLEWFRQMSAMGVNSVRVYTLLPPSFYYALSQFNEQEAKQPLYIFQEIWAGDPPRDNLFDSRFQTDYEQQIHNAVDAIHGQADVPIVSGQTGGIYTADVSEYVLGFLIGRQLPPSLVITTNRQNGRVNRYEGKYLRIADGNPTEVWLTQMCDKAVQYEVEKYNWQRPVAFVNWPALDALFHPTETPMDKELQIRRALGERIPPEPAGTVHDDDDVVSLDEEKVSRQPAMEAGYFAFYHIYPFYPDFIVLDPLYRRAKDDVGVNSYYGYLQDLKRHLKNTPVVVGEYGLSTSLGIAHFNPNGWNHGGLEEAQQAEGLLRLTRNIKDAGYAGGLVFEWIDEWWKQTWITARFEQPADRRALWHDDMDPAESFGLQQFFLDPPREPETIYQGQSIEPGTIKAVSVTSDPESLYVTLQLAQPAGKPLDWDKSSYVLALNTCGRPCGSKTLPVDGLSGRPYELGFNFLVRLNGPSDARLLVARNYNPYRSAPVPGLPELVDVGLTRRQSGTVVDSSQFEEIIVQTNRRRYGRDGTFYAAERYSRSVLLNGVFDPKSPGYNSLGQWYYDSQTQELKIRLSWGLLMVMDPSSGFVFWETNASSDPVGATAKWIAVAAMSNASAGNAWQVVPPASGETGLNAATFVWPTWDRFTTRQAPKKSFGLLKEEFVTLTGRGQKGR